ncbi:hypothetical protein Hanom_Chr16g01503691 [Helianthus anomalus]
MGIVTRDRLQFFIFSFVSSSDPLFEYLTLGFLVLWIIIFIFSATYCISIIKTQPLLLRLCFVFLFLLLFSLIFFFFQ